MSDQFERLRAEIARTPAARTVGRIKRIGQGTVRVSGFSGAASVADLVEFDAGGRMLRGEVIDVETGDVVILPEGSGEGLRIGDPVLLDGPSKIYPDESWLGRVIDPFGAPLDGRPLSPGLLGRTVRAEPPPPVERRGLGPRLETGLCLFNTILPIARGQRLGLFAGSGVGKSTLLAMLARGLDCDVVVIALIGERGRELREFIERALGQDGLKRAVVVAATSDRSPLSRRRCAYAAMAVAEYFRDKGKHVLFLADSVTRLAEAHREVALSAGEPPALDGFPPTTVPAITSLCERAGPGAERSGDITAIFTVLVAGSDMEGAVADILRGVLDGHVVLDRQIAERGRFPAVDILRSVSRSLPEAANKAENELILKARSVLGTYERAELMIQAGLYSAGSDRAIDAAILAWPRLDAFAARMEHQNIQGSFGELSRCLSASEPEPEGGEG